MTERIQQAPLEVLPAEATEALTRAEVDIQIATAHRFPRSIETFEKRALTMATRDPEIAGSCTYTLTRREKSGEVKIIQGPSIRLAEIAAVCFQNLRVAVGGISRTATTVTVRAMAHDLENNVAVSIEKMGRTSYRDGTPYNDDMAIMVANATASKARRDALLAVIPRSLIAGIQEAAKKVAAGKGESFDQRKARALAWLKGLKVELPRVWAVLGVKGEADLTIEHLHLLNGFKTAIADEVQTMDQAFPPITAAAKPIFRSVGGTLATGSQEPPPQTLSPPPTAMPHHPLAEKPQEGPIPLEGGPSQKPVLPEVPKTLTANEALAGMLKDAGSNFDRLLEVMGPNGLGLLSSTDGYAQLEDLPSAAVEACLKGRKGILKALKGQKP